MNNITPTQAPSNIDVEKIKTYLETMNLAQNPAVRGNPIKLISETVNPIVAAGRR